MIFFKEKKDSPVGVSISRVDLAHTLDVIFLYTAESNTEKREETPRNVHPNCCSPIFAVGFLEISASLLLLFPILWPCKQCLYPKI